MIWFAVQTPYPLCWQWALVTQRTLYVALLNFAQAVIYNTKCLQHKKMPLKLNQHAYVLYSEVKSKVRWMKGSSRLLLSSMWNPSRWNSKVTIFLILSTQSGRMCWALSVSVMSLVDKKQTLGWVMLPPDGIALLDSALIECSTHCTYYKRKHYAQD